MRIKAKIKSRKFKTILFKDLKRSSATVKAGYPDKNPKSHERDLNGDSAIFKAYEINFSNKNYIPYLQISYENNIIKYKKIFEKIFKLKLKKQKKEKIKLGKKMVKDIQDTLEDIQYTPVSKNKGCIFGAVSFSLEKK